ncbi:TIGR01777 family protein [Vibrio breoganii]|uniref:TIGR01777 family oxidoreductase n=1 Tax=Vibrio breoganii TaxID=553239 RepID=UPI000C8566F2|nr:TIGR01777 family oxidoreductase [Vibrio breoganii]PMG93970.1 TIGR01777 family protein [Vibrio breoganii]PMM87524.1 TIGR01777 family protein [Vibrio breoganii]TKF90235.1 TIGR01777 family protein [Vibrio breoganii]
MHILITGGTGFIGRALVKQLIPHQMTILTRDSDNAAQQLKHVNPNCLHFVQSLDHLQDLCDFDAVINLAGEPIVNKRWTDKQKKRICDSRWDITRQIADLIKCSSNPPKVFVSGSAVGIYGDQNQIRVDEETPYKAEGFPHYVCQEWEDIANQARSEQTRVALIRTGIVLGQNGGALEKMLLPYKLGLGGPLGAGQQYMPWIHIQDMVRAIQFLLETEICSGIFNMVAPHPVTNKEFSQTLAKTLSRPHFLFTPKFAMQMALGESSCLLFDSVKAKPKRLTEMGFTFNYSRVQPALSQILSH